MWDWIVQNWFELTAALLGVIGIFLQIHQKPLYWLVSLVMVSMYIWVYFDSGFYADMSLQVYYFVISIYGWLFWMFGKKKQAESTSKKDIPVTRLKKKPLLLSMLISLILFVVIYLILKHLTDSTVPLGDAFTTALSFVATWMLARKILENWLFWIVVDLVSVGLYIYKGLYPTAALFAFLTIMAVFGFFAWKKDMQRV
ncbi:MAG: nicotinamide riboside transporter PnuC [Bacteroidales bacterium]|jgi:nicotinamide mononucleotide transporter|nr:nicotinamide riboside transporter PnuC [Bacteroidales bacterium]